MWIPLAIKIPRANADNTILMSLDFLLFVIKKPTVQDAIKKIHPIMLQIVIGLI
jgi:hypothetical protein